MELKGKSVIITGATGGIGGEIARAFAAKGAKLALVGRNRKRLQDLEEEFTGKGTEVISITADLSLDEDIKKMVASAEEKFGSIDIVINNAGAMAFNPVLKATEEEVRSVVMTNIYGPIRLAQAVLPGMLQRKSGRIVNIGSIFGSLSFPYFGVYSASKCAIRGFSEALRREILGTGVGVTYIAPRGTKTSQTESFLEMAKKTGMNLDDPKKVAQIVVNSVIKEKREVYIGGPERLFVLINKLFPKIIDKALRKNVDIMAGDVS